MRVLLIDDDEALTEMMCEYLDASGVECERANDPTVGLEMALTRRFDAIVLDVMMPRLDGIEVLRRLRRESAVPVLMLTARDDSAERVIGLELGADDYLPKPIYPRELVARLRAVLRRVQAEPRERREAELELGPLWLSPASRQATLARQDLLLTVIEFNLLVELARRSGDVLSKDELYERTLGRKREPYDRSVDVHVSNLRQKLGSAGGGVEIETARGVGYRLRLS